MTTGQVGCIFAFLHLFGLLFFGIGLLLTIPLHIVCHILVDRGNRY